MAELRPLFVERLRLYRDELGAMVALGAGWASGGAARRAGDLAHNVAGMAATFDCAELGEEGRALELSLRGDPGLDELRRLTLFVASIDAVIARSAEATP